MPPARVVLWVASLGGLALCARSIFIGAVPLFVAFAAFFTYVTVAVTGVLVPQLEMFGDASWRGDPKTNTVALTFDDGPHPVTTRRVLAILARGGVRATFFVIGEKVERHPDVVREIAGAGHGLAMHGYRHDRLYSLKPPNAVRDDIVKTRDAIERAAGVRPRWFRPPIGHLSPRTAAGAERAGVQVVAWSVRGLDGLRSADADRVITRIERGLRPGAIVLLHDAAESDDYAPASLAALPRILEIIERKGLRAVSLDELLTESEPS
jgi:peptidoglycan/xylan/chitin deacetylase (PgdA/CDA1 family)